MDLTGTIRGLEERASAARKLAKEATRIATAALAAPDPAAVEQLKLELTDVEERQAKLEHDFGYAAREPGRIGLADLYGGRVQVAHDEPDTSMAALGIDQGYISLDKLRKWASNGA